MVSLNLPFVFHLSVFADLPSVFADLPSVFVELPSGGNAVGVTSAVTGKIRRGRGGGGEACVMTHIPCTCQVHAGVLSSLHPTCASQAFRASVVHLHRAGREDCKMACGSLREHLVQQVGCWVVQLETEAQRGYET